MGFNGPNPTQGIKKFKEQSRDRFLQPSELPTFMAAPGEVVRLRLRNAGRIARPFRGRLIGLGAWT